MGVAMRTNPHPSFGMKTTQAIRDLFFVTPPEYIIPVSKIAMFGAVARSPFASEKTSSLILRKASDVKVAPGNM